MSKPGALLGVPYQRFLTPAGLPLSGGTLSFFAAGTSTPQAVYHDADLLVPWGTSVTLDAAGGATIYLAALAYKINLVDSLGVQQPGWPIDNVYDIGQRFELPKVTVTSLEVTPGGPVLSLGTSPVSDQHIGLGPNLNISAPVYIASSLVVDKGSLFITADESALYLYDGGFPIAVQAGPRGKESGQITAVSITSNVLTVTATQSFLAGDSVYLAEMYYDTFLDKQIVTVLASGLSGTQFKANFTHADYTNLVSYGFAVESFIKAATTLILPDLAEGSATPNSGFVLGVTGTVAASAGGHGLCYGGSGGVVHDSGIILNSDIGFPSYTQGIQWLNGANLIHLLGAAATGNRTLTLPDITGTVPVLVLATHTPSSTNDTGVAGQIAWDTSFVYICVATNSWGRAALSFAF